MRRFAASALVVVLAVVLAMAVATEAVKRSSASEASYQAWCTKFDKSFCTGADRQQRSEVYLEGFEAFQKQVAIIERHNADPASTFTMGLNEHFSIKHSSRWDNYDDAADRAARQSSGSAPIGQPMGNNVGSSYTTGIPTGNCIYGASGKALTFTLPNITAMQYKLNVSTLLPLQSQGSYAVCYAIVVAEMLHAKFPNTPTPSFNQLVSCTDSKNYYEPIPYPYVNNGVSGGFLGPCLDYVQSMGAFAADVNWPLGNSYTGQCYGSYWGPNRYGSTFDYYGIAGENNFPRAVSYFQKPLGVMLNVEGSSWINYAGGLIQAGATCGTAANHALTYIGYGNYNNPYAPAYHVLRNSWGAWGTGNGIVNIAWGGNVCGLGLYPALVIP